MSKKISLTVVVNGQPTVVDALDDAPLSTIIPDALRQTENSGQPPENWELRDADGNLLDLAKKIGDYGFPTKVRLFLNLKAGVGGHHASPTEQYVDPAVSRAKFDRELAELPFRRGRLPRPRVVPDKGALACARGSSRLA